MTEFREISAVQMRPVFTSLGLSADSFTKVAGVRAAPFDAGTNCGPAHPDCVWLFRDADVYLFNLRTRTIDDGPAPLASISANWPPLFGSGVDAAAWAGPKYPTTHYFFRGAQVIRRNGASQLIDAGPVDLVAHGFGSAVGTPIAAGVGYGFADQSADRAGYLYLGKGDTLIVHNLNTGKAAEASRTLSGLYGLPEDWQDGADVAFFGCGEEASLLYLFAGTNFACIDTRDNHLVETGGIAEKFSALARFVPAPQLFLVEDYALTNFCSDPVRGEYINEVTILPRTKTTVRVITEQTTSATDTHTQSILESHSADASAQFNDEVQAHQESERSAESYRYDLKSNLHGEASADGVWGGEVDASLDVQGGSNDNRERYADSAMNTVQKQVSQSSAELSQKVISGEDTTTSTAHVLRSQEQTVDNSASDQTLTVRFYRVVQPTLSILSLTGAGVAYANGRDPLKVFDLTQTGSLLDQCLVDEAKRQTVYSALEKILGNILDYQKQPQSLLDPAKLAAGELRQRAGIRTTFKDPADDGETSVTVSGIAVEGHKFFVRMPEATTQD